MMRLEYFIHDVAQVPHDITLQVIGSIPDSMLTSIQESFPMCSDIGWDFTEYSDGRTFSELLGVDLKRFVNEDSITFNFDHSFFSFDDYVSQLYPAIVNEAVSTSFCKAIYANLHDDFETISSRGQIMFIADNPSNHTLYSIDENKIVHSIIPQAGDIIFLDISCPHALIPNTNHIETLDDVLPLRMGMLAIGNF